MRNTRRIKTIYVSRMKLFKNPIRRVFAETPISPESLTPSPCTPQLHSGPCHAEKRVKEGMRGREREIAKDEYVSYLPAVKTAQSCAGRQKDGESEGDLRERES